MRRVIIEKFKDLYLQHRLLETRTALLIEGNSHGDTYWGASNGVGKTN